MEPRSLSLFITSFVTFVFSRRDLPVGRSQPVPSLCRSRCAAFTVSEVLVALAVLASVLYIVTAVAFGAYRASNSSVRKTQALFQARSAMEQVKNVSLSQLPPLRVAVSADKPTIVRVPNLRVDPDSLNAQWEDGSAFDGDLSFDHERSELKLENSNRAGLAYFDFKFHVESIDGFESVATVTPTPDRDAKLVTIRTEWNQRGGKRSVELRRLRAL